VKNELERVPVPGEDAARERAWGVVRAAHAAREPTPRPSRWPRIAAVAIALAVVAAGVASSPGRAVLDELREVVGVERADPALFSLPAPGRLLVSSDAGVWIVQQDGSKRLLGEYREASWSPFGRFVVATRENELAALEPDGDVRWTLARPGVRSPRWTGTESDTRIAYVDRTGLRVVAGDGAGDRLVVPRFDGAIAWRPGPRFLLTSASERELRITDVSTGRTVVRVARRPAGSPLRVDWTSDGRHVLVLVPRAALVYDARGRLVGRRQERGGWPNLDASFRPGSSQLGLAQARGARSAVVAAPPAAFPGFVGSGAFEDLAWAPDGRWYLVTWPTADQWVFVRTTPGGRRIVAFANVSEQFRSRSFPRVEGWCCADG
jgi:hypothetical protein